MAKIVQRLTELIGHTPLLDISDIAKEHGCRAHVIAKLENMNPLGSAKDRAALSMIDDAVRAGKLFPGGQIVEPTSGNTGIGLAWIAAERGYQVTIVMPDTMTVERRTLLRALGARVVLTPGILGMTGAIHEAEAICARESGTIMLHQFSNPANAAAHETTTGPEIWEDTDGAADIFVAGVGTGGTLTGVGRYIKAQKPSFYIVAVEPADSSVIKGKEPCSHKIQGIGAGFIPDNYDGSLVDEVVAIESESAFAMSREIAAKKGLLVGISAGAALAAAYEVAARPENAGKTLVVLLPDSGERYLSTQLFSCE